MSYTDLKNWSFHLKVEQRGLSFIEVLVVLIIIGLMMTFTTQRLVSPSSQIRYSIKKLSRLMKKIKIRARIENKTYRLVINLPKDQKKEQTYWVESTSQKALLLTTQEQETLRKELEKNEDTKSKESEVEADPQGFSANPRILPNPPAHLPKGLFFSSLEWLGSEEVEKLENGRIYIYFFPQGFMQPSALHLTNRKKLHWTLVIEPLTGHVKIFSKNQPLKDLITKW